MGSWGWGKEDPAILRVAMTVPVGGAERERPCKESNVVTVKRVKGQLLQREESYTEALPFEDDNPDADDNDGDVVLKQYNLKTQLSHASSQKPKAQPALQANNAPSPNVVGSPALRRNVRAWCDATGLPTTIIIRCKDRVFYLHKVRLPPLQPVCAEFFWIRSIFVRVVN